MENMKLFLETSSIHGLTFISTTRNNWRLFWILVVIFGFIGASVMIYQSFQAWDESPVTTTIETLPIEKIAFPKVTVCPPKNTYTDLNYDLIRTESVDLEHETRVELTNLAMNLLQNHSHVEILKNLSKMEEKDRYFNWYNGYTQITVPYPNSLENKYDQYYKIHTYDKSGSISTKNFGENFDADKVDEDLFYSVEVYTPESYIGNSNVSLYVEIEKHTFSDDIIEFHNADGSLIYTRSNNFTAPGKKYQLFLSRKASREKINAAASTLDKMPGFKIAWKFSDNVHQEAYFYLHEDDKTGINYRTRTRSFIRYS